MNQRTAKILRKIVGVDTEDATVKRLYRKFKKEYSKTPSAHRQEFLEKLALIYTNNTNQ